MNYVDYYKTLDVAKNAEASEINKAFRKLARKYHPDLNKDKGAEDKFKDINEAYEVLKDDKKRRQYDAFGNNYKNGDRFRPPPGFNANHGFSNHGFSSQGFSQGGQGGFSDFFSSIFGAGGGGQSSFNVNDLGDILGNMGGSQKPVKGADIETEISVSLEDVFLGAKKNISLQTSRGEIKSYTITIPKGIESGKKIRLTGEGANGTGGLKGDLYLKIKISEHDRFKRKGANLYASLPLSPWEAALGSSTLESSTLGSLVKIETIDSVVEIKIPAGVSSGQKMRVKGAGMPDGKNRGDLILEIKIVMPKELTKDEIELFEKLASISAFQPRKK